jgi:hypothetical protein
MSDDMYSSWSDSVTDNIWYNSEKNAGGTPAKDHKGGNGGTHEYYTQDIEDRNISQGVNDCYASIALCAVRLRVVSLENELSEALQGVRPLGVGLDRVMRVQTQLDKARNQATLLERDYVRYGH